jgi:hypothetical protein
MEAKLIPLILLLGCGPKYLENKYITLSESPCVDGVILNMDHRGCKSFYWGANADGPSLKIRCTYVKEDNFWTKSSFYSFPHEYSITSNWSLFCKDRYVQMYAVPTGIEFEYENR